MHRPTTLSHCFLFLCVVLTSFTAHAAPAPTLQHSEASLPDAPFPGRLSGYEPLARWSVEVLALHDPDKGWGAVGRVNYRLDRRWSLTVGQSRAVTEAGFSLRLGGIKAKD